MGQTQGTAQPIPGAPPVVKPGHKTTEFYAFLAGLGTLLFGFLQTKCSFTTVDAMTVMGLVGSYIIGRSWVKAKASK